MARLYANENFPLPLVQGLRQFGHDLITIQETGKAEQRTSDEDVLRFAMADDRAVLTLNRKHFIRLHQEQPGSVKVFFLYDRSCFVSALHLRYFLVWIVK